MKKTNKKTHLLHKGSSAWGAEVSQEKVAVLLSHIFCISVLISPYTQRQTMGSVYFIQDFTFLLEQ